jgi:hypothetical protein
LATKSTILATKSTFVVSTKRYEYRPRNHYFSMMIDPGEI